LISGKNGVIPKEATPSLREIVIRDFCVKSGILAVGNRGRGSSVNYHPNDRFAVILLAGSRFRICAFDHLRGGDPIDHVFVLI
jgi:hypothetical protein